MAARIYPFPTPLPQFLRKSSAPDGDNFSLVFGGGMVVGALMVGLAWFVFASSSEPAPAPPTGAAFNDDNGADFDSSIAVVDDDALKRTQ